MASDGPPRRLGQSGQAEIGEVPAFELCRTVDQGLRVSVDAKAEAHPARPSPFALLDRLVSSHLEPLPWIAAQHVRRMDTRVNAACVV